MRSVTITSRTGLRAGLWNLAAPVAAAMAAVFVFHDRFRGSGLVLVIGALGALVLVMLPLEVLPAITLLLAVLAPMVPIGPLGTVGIPSAASLVLLLWATRLALRRPSLVARPLVSGNPLAPWAIALAGWMTVLIVASDFPRPAFGWSIAFVVSVLVCCFGSIDDATQRRLVTAWIVAGLVVAVHVAVEFVLKDDFLYGRVYEAFGSPSPQHWSTYRPEGSFRHPIPAGIFLATAATLSAGQALRTSSLRLAGISAFIGVATVLTVTRGALLALLAGVIIIVAAWTRNRYPDAPRIRSAVIALGGASVFAAFNVGPIADRLDSVEATRSLGARFEIVDIAVRAASASNFIGSGPGTSQLASARFNLRDLPLESSILQVMVSLGIIGLVLFAGLFGTAFIVGFKSGRVPGAAALAALVAGTATYNGLEAKQGLLILIGLAFLLCLPTIEHRAAAPDRRESP